MPIVNNHWRFHAFFGLLTFLGAVEAVDFASCLADVQAGNWGTVGGTDSTGQPASPISTATGVTYELCVRACGSGAEPFVWNIFSQQFTSWLLPYLALIAQLPFGADDKLDNVVAVLLSVGSPTLAVYSLAITTLNGHWIARRFSRFSYPNVRSAVQILSRLQQTPIEVINGSLLASLVVLPENDKWWSQLVGKLDYTHTWSISSVASIIWVATAFLFTVIDSFTVTINSSILNANGQGVGSVYLWLLPVVIGWLQLGPKCHSGRLHQAVGRVNAEAYIASDRGPIPADDSEGTPDRAIFLLQRVDSVRRDEQRSPPIYNYARFLPWVQAVEKVSLVFEQASQRAERYESVDPAIPWGREKGGKVRPENRRGTLAQVEAYVNPPRAVPRSYWGPEVLSRFLVSSFLALALTWSTTGAAVIVVWFTPTVGLGCRSGAYILYGVVSILVWMMLVTSSALAHYSTQSFDGHGEPVRTSARVAGNLSIILRRLGKVLATCNAVWIVVACILQFSSFFDRCYCNSSVFGLGHLAYDVITIVPADIATMKGAWGGAVALTCVSSMLFVGWVNIFVDPPLPTE
ncbi:hypothetical protein B0H17DRAFT_1096383 [Mycena rosella]|uniref:Uncharacterized protein n=1 Tax=Mycena rosella TaxID=1033263 RepID=A0AAD7G4L1_MYCRO|nr:hypothetical protein B0H17DRAFT_1096383 [Mycena rosella]